MSGFLSAVSSVLSGASSGGSKSGEWRDTSKDLDKRIAAKKQHRKARLVEQRKAYRADLERAISKLTVFPGKYFVVPEDRPGSFEWSNEDEAFPGSAHLTLEKYKELFCQPECRMMLGNRGHGGVASIDQPLEHTRVLFTPLPENRISIAYISAASGEAIELEIFKTSFQWPDPIPTLIPGLKFSGPPISNRSATDPVLSSATGESGPFVSSSSQCSRFSDPVGTTYTGNEGSCYTAASH